METAIRICLLALTACGAALILRGKNPQGALMLSAATCLVLAVQVIPALKAVYTYGRQLAGYTGIDVQLLAPLLKVIALALCVRITAELCRDSGERAIAAQVELAGAALGILLAMPLVERALGLIGGL